ncbi:circularly permuted type 2 ATP-grasp protein [Primorskyibacter sp. 2E107]|uniref:circularly permuted type 2 ATP-grasp protein n=1 Tax=Primorskyibacter sp. 2E107 TaxID=3403458 RepID=UPI003AF6BC37
MQKSERTVPSELLKAYARQMGVSDEMLDADGRVRPAWVSFINHISSLGAAQLENRFARGDQYLRDAGILFRQYDDALSTEREWPLSHIPVLLDETEWQEISAGLVERAELLEFVARDVYGANTLVSSGQLPAAILSQNPAWLRPMIGVKPRDGNFLNFLSFELGRGPDGKWWVISDLVEAPSTAGFAIENRVAMGRVFPNFFSRSNIHRLAGFFQAFQQNLFNLRGRSSEGQIAVLTPGPMHQNYAEHAYIARYLGLLLLEGEDLIVQNGKALVRTIDGPKPISLLWNRVPSGMVDPLELDPGSLIGTPGLLEAVRTQGLKTLNAIGSGVLETRALMAFLPQIARSTLAKELRIPNIATWWCGGDVEREHVIVHRDRMMIGSAFSTVPLMSDQGTTILTSELDTPQAENIAALLRSRGRELVGQEAITLSTTPTWEQGGLAPRPVCIRIFLGRTAKGWEVMPGGYARVSAGQDAKAFAMQRGGKVADVWIVSDEPVQKSSLLDSTTSDAVRSAERAALPSRAAENLFWLGRYVERAELNLRLVRGYYARLSEGVPHTSRFPAFQREKLMAGVEPGLDAIADWCRAPLQQALQAASKVGDRFSPDGMMALRALVEDAHAFETRGANVDEIPREISALLRQVSGFAGLVHENMYRTDGWRFLSLGISLERASNMCHVMACLTSREAPEGSLDLALEIGDSVIAHRARFSIMANRLSVLDILGIDDQNPRSIRYHVARARRHIEELPGHGASHVLTDVARRALTLETFLAVHHVDDLTPKMLLRVRQDIWDLSDALSAAHLV